MLRRKKILISGKKYLIWGDPSDRYFSEYILARDTFFDTPLAYIEKHVEPDAVVIDIGANLGLVACSVASVAPLGKVIAVEASPKIYKILKKNVKQNNIKNVQTVQIALSDKQKTLKFFEDRDFLAGSRAVSDKDQRKGVVTVKALPLDILIKDYALTRIDLIKIDVEGHELQVLKGAKNTLKKFKPFCLIEFNSYVMIKENNMLPQEFLKELEVLFPRIFAFNRETLALDEITDDLGSFLTRNLLGGCVDDLVCGYGDLPAQSLRFTNISSK